MPSEYSDVSTSSCRTTSDDGEIDDNKNNNKNQEQDPVTVSIVVSTTADATKQEPVPQEQQQKSEPRAQDDPPLSKEARMARVHRVASELLSTEEQYVTVLYLIDQVTMIYRLLNIKFFTIFLKIL